jgi:hypothetical protein
MGVDAEELAEAGLRLHPIALTSSATSHTSLIAIDEEAKQRWPGECPST